MTLQLFQSISELFCPKNPLDVAREDPILLKKLSKSDTKWGTKKDISEIGY